jgi:hypothetical protein
MVSAITEIGAPPGDLGHVAGDLAGFAMAATVRTHARHHPVGRGRAGELGT